MNMKKVSMAHLILAIYAALLLHTATISIITENGTYDLVTGLRKLIDGVLNAFRPSPESFAQYYYPGVYSPSRMHQFGYPIQSYAVDPALHSPNQVDEVRNDTMIVTSQTQPQPPIAPPMPPAPAPQGYDGVMSSSALGPGTQFGVSKSLTQGSYPSASSPTPTF